MAEERTLSDLAKQLKQINKQIGTDNAGNTTTAGLTAAQALKEQQRQQKDADAQQALDINAYAQVTNESKRLYSSQEELQALRDEGAYDAVLIHRLRKQQEAALLSDEGVEGDEYKTTSRALELATQFADEYAASTGQAQPRYVTDYLSNPELVENLASEDTVPELVGKAIRSAVAGSLGAVADASNIASEAPLVGDLYKGYASLLNRGKEGVEEFFDATDIGSLGNSLVVSTTMNRMRLPEGHPDRLTLAAGGLKVARDIFTSADGLQDFGATMVGTLVPGAGAAKATQVYSKLGPAAQAYAAGVTSSLAGGGLDASEEDTAKQSATRILTAVLAGSISAIPGSTVAGSITNRSRLFESRVGQTVTGSLGEGTQEAFENVGQGLASSSPDGAFTTQLSPEDILEAKINAIVGLNTGVVVGGPIAAITARPSDPELEGEDAEAPPPTKKRSEERSDEARKNYEAMAGAATAEEARASAEALLESGDRIDVEAHADALNEIIVEAVEADDVDSAEQIDKAADILSELDAVLAEPKNEESDTQNNETPVVDTVVDTTSADTASPAPADSDPTPVGDSVEAVADDTATPVEESLDPVEDSDPEDNRPLSEEVADRVNDLVIQAAEDPSLEADVDALSKELATLQENEASIAEDQETIDILFKRREEASSSQQRNLFDREIENLSNNIEKLEQRNDEIASRAGVKPRVKLLNKPEDVSVPTETEVASKDLDVNELISKLRTIVSGDNVNRYDLRDDQIIRARLWLEKYDGGGFGKRLNKFKDEARKLLNRANRQGGRRLNDVLGRRTLAGNVEAPAPGAFENGAIEAPTVDPIERAQEFFNPGVVAAPETPRAARNLSNLQGYVNQTLETLGVRQLDALVPVTQAESEGVHSYSVGKFAAIGINPDVLEALDTDDVRAVQAIRHEVGHHIVSSTWGSASPETQQALIEDFQSYLEEVGNPLKDRLDFDTDFEGVSPVLLWALAGPSRTPADLQAGQDAVFDKEYIESFSEYLAQRFGSAIEARDANDPSTLGSFFSNLVDTLRKWFNVWQGVDGPSAESDALFDNYLQGLIETANLRADQSVGPAQVPAEVDPLNTGNFDFIKIGQAAKENTTFQGNDIPELDRRYTVNNAAIQKETQKFAQGLVRTLQTTSNLFKDLPEPLRDKLSLATQNPLESDVTATQDLMQYVLENIGNPEFSDMTNNMLIGRVTRLGENIRARNKDIFSPAIAPLDIVSYVYPAHTPQFQESRIFRGPPDPDEYVTVDENGKKTYVKLKQSDKKRPEVSEVEVAKTFAEDVRRGFVGGPQFTGDARNRGQQYLDDKNSLYARAKRFFENSREQSRRVENRLDRVLRTVPNFLETTRAEMLDKVDSPVLNSLIEGRRFNELLHIHSQIGTHAARAQGLFDRLELNSKDANGKNRTVSLAALHSKAEQLSNRIRNITGATGTEQQLTEDKVLVAMMAEEANPILWALNKAEPLPLYAKRFADIRKAFKENSLDDKQLRRFASLASRADVVSNIDERADYAPSGMTDQRAERVLTDIRATEELSTLYDELADTYQNQLRYMDKVRKSWGVETRSDRRARAAYKFKRFVPLERTELHDTTGLDYYFRERDFEGTFGIHSSNNSIDNDRTDAGLDPMRQSVTATINQRSKQLLSEFAGRDTAASALINSVGSNFSQSYRDQIDTETYSTSLTEGSSIREMTIDSKEFREFIKEPDVNRIVYYEGEKAVVMRLNDEGTKAVKGIHSAYIKAFEDSQGTAKKIYDTIGYGTRFMSKQQTWYHLPFTLYNTFREALHTSFLLQLDNDLEKGETMQFIKNAYDLRTYPDMARWVRYQLDGTPKAKQKQTDLMLNSPNAEMLKDLREFYASGGPTVISDSFTRSVRSSGLIKDLGAKVPGSAKAKLKQVDDVFEVINTAAELTTRLSYYRLQKSRGVEPRIAANRAKDLTNFENRGIFGGPMGVLYMFSRAAAVGNVKALDAFLESDRKGRVATIMIGIGALHYMAAYLLSGDDEEDRNKVEQSSGKIWTRNAVYNLPGTNTEVRIPFGFGVTSFLQAAGAQLARAGLGHQTMEETVKNLESVSLDSLEFLPAGSGNNVWTKVTPTPIRPWVDVALNLNQFDAPIRGRFSPESFTKHALEGGRDNTFGGPWDDLARGLSAATGGGVKFNPDDLAYISRYYAGFMAYTYEAAHENAVNAFSGDEEYILNKRKGLWPLTSVISPYFSRQAEVYYNACPIDSDDPACKKSRNELSKIGRKYQQPIRDRSKTKAELRQLQTKQKKEFEEVYRKYNVSVGLTRPD